MEHRYNNNNNIENILKYLEVLKLFITRSSHCSSQIENKKKD